MRRHYRILRYVERHNKTPYSLLIEKYGEAVSELRYYDDIDVDTNDEAYITKNGRMLLSNHRVTVTNIVLSVVSIAIALAALIISLLF